MFYHFRNIPEIVHITSVQESRKFVNSVSEGGKEQKNLSVSMKFSTGAEISVVFLGLEGRCHVFDLKSHPDLMREGGLGELFEDGEVTKVGMAPHGYHLILYVNLQRSHHAFGTAILKWDIR